MSRASTFSTSTVTKGVDGRVKPSHDERKSISATSQTAVMWLKKLRPLALAQEAAEQAALALARNEIDVADKLGSALPALQHDLAAVEGFELGAMGDADHGRVGQFLVEQLHHEILASGIEGRGRFIEDDDIRVVQKQPREGE